MPAVEMNTMAYLVFHLSLRETSVCIKFIQASSLNINLTSKSVKQPSYASVFLYYKVCSYLHSFLFITHFTSPHVNKSRKSDQRQSNTPAPTQTSVLNETQVPVTNLPTRMNQGERS